MGRNHVLSDDPGPSGATGQGTGFAPGGTPQQPIQQPLTRSKLRTLRKDWRGTIGNQRKETPNGLPQRSKQTQERQTIQAQHTKDQGGQHERRANEGRNPTLMKCYAPIRAYKTPNGIVFSELRRHGDIQAQLDIPCGQCIGCRERRASDWELRIMHEAQQWKENCFITLTYKRDALPRNGSLDYKDLQLFMKRLYKHNGGIRYYAIGEYGPETNRPHYHACLFGKDFHDRIPAGKSESGETHYSSAELRELWQDKGNVSVQDLNNQTASYCARYIMTKKLGYNSQYLGIHEDGTTVTLEPPKAIMSLKPGIGATFFDKYKRDIYPHDYVISRGTKRRPPKYYDKLLERTAPDTHGQIQNEREIKAANVRNENTPQRLTAQEQFHVARIKNKQLRKSN